MVRMKREDNRAPANNAKRSGATSETRRARGREETPRRAAASSRPDPRRGSAAPTRKDPGKDREQSKAVPRNDAGTQARERRNQGQDRRKHGVLPATVAAGIRKVSARTIILFVLLVFFVVLSLSPVTRNLQATNNLEKAKGQLKKEKAVTESLEREVAEARSLDYVEREARKQRKVAPGEILYIVTTDSSENEVKYRVKALQSMDEAWQRVRQMLHSVPRAGEGEPTSK